MKVFLPVVDISEQLRARLYGPDGRAVSFFIITTALLRMENA